MTTGKDSADLWDLLQVVTESGGWLKLDALETATHRVTVNSWIDHRLVEYRPHGFGCELRRLAPLEVTIPVSAEADYFWRADSADLLSLLRQQMVGRTCRVRIECDVRGQCQVHEWSGPPNLWEVGNSVLGLRENLACVRSVGGSTPLVARRSRESLRAKVVQLVEVGTGEGLETGTGLSRLHMREEGHTADVNHVSDLGLLREVLLPATDLVYLIAHGSNGHEGPRLGHSRDESTHWLGQKQLAELLREAGVQVAFLRACKTGTAGQVGSMAMHLQRGGIGLVVGFDDNVLAGESTDAMVGFHECLLDCVAHALPIDLALQAARRLHLSTPDRSRLVGYLHPEFDGIFR